VDCFYVKEGFDLYDIAVAGAGVAGSYMAYRLASLGYKVAVFEEHEKIGEPVQCTGIIGAECFERFPFFDGTVLSTTSSAKTVQPLRRRDKATQGQRSGIHYRPRCL